MLRYFTQCPFMKIIGRTEFPKSAFTCLKLTIETLEQGVKGVTPCSSVCIVNFEHVNTGWVGPISLLVFPKSCEGSYTLITLINALLIYKHTTCMPR